MDTVNSNLTKVDLKTIFSKYPTKEVLYKFFEN